MKIVSNILYISTPRGVHTVTTDMVTVKEGHSRSSEKYLRLVYTQVDISMYTCLREIYPMNRYIMIYNFSH